MNAAFDIGDLFYIILTILFIAAGAIGKKKRPPKPQKVETNVEEEVVAPPTQDNLEKKLQELFSDYYKPESEASTEEIAIEEPAVEETQEIPYVEESLEAASQVLEGKQAYVSSWETKDLGSEAFSDIGEMISDRIEAQTFNWQHEEDNDLYDAIRMSEGKELISDGDDEDLQELVNDFNARKGVLYSEIFNRKEF